MANHSLAKFVASKPLTRSVSFAAGSCSRLFKTKKSREEDCEYNHNLKIICGRGDPVVPQLFYEAFCHRLPATKNLARLLNLMDDQCHLQPCGHPRWDVIQDAKALYLFLHKSGYPKNAVNEFVPGISPHVIDHVRVTNINQMIEIIVGITGPNPTAIYENYLITLYLRHCIVSDAKVDMENEVVKITIPKEKEKWIHKIIGKPKFFV